MKHLPFAAAILLLLGCAAPDPGQSPADTGAPVARGTADATVPATLASAGHSPVTPADSLTVTVYKSPTCGCCRNWVAHMREAGFTVVAIDTADLQGVMHAHGVGDDLASCHTATVGGYVLEGHVPAADVRRLLAERPAITGLAVPGMPMGSPGMEGPMSQRYDVVAFDRAGGRSVFASH